MFKKKLLFLIGIMLVLSLTGYGICALAKKDGTPEPEGKVQLVTSFYPVYVLAENLAENAEDTVVVNLTENQAGCLHDYQLTPKDMKLLVDADALLINGAGMELFVEQAVKSCPSLPVITATQNIELLTGVAHDHEHAGEDTEESENAEHSHELNGHVWMDVERYRMQASVLCEALKNLDKTQAGAYDASYLTYDKKLEQLSLEVSELAKDTKGIPVVLFHEAYAYFADSLGMEPLAVIALDHETVPGAGEIAEVIEEIKYHGSALIFIEEAYLSHAQKIAEETGAVIVTINPLVTGSGEADDYLTGMYENLSAVRAALESLQ